MKLNRMQLRKIIMESIHHANVKSVKEMVEIFREAALKAGFYEVEHVKHETGELALGLDDRYIIGQFTRLTPEQQSLDPSADDYGLDDLRFNPGDEKEILDKLIKADSRIGSMMRDPSMSADTNEEPFFPAYFTVYLDKAHKF